MRPTHVLAIHLSVHDSLVALHLMRIASVDVAAMCMLLGNVGYAQPNTAHRHQQQQQTQQHSFHYVFISAKAVMLYVASFCLLVGISA